MMFSLRDGDLNDDGRKPFRMKNSYRFRKFDCYWHRYLDINLIEVFNNIFMETRYSNLCFISSINVNQTLITIQVTNLSFHKPVNLPMYNPFKSSFINQYSYLFFIYSF